MISRVVKIGIMVIVSATIAAGAYLLGKKNGSVDLTLVQADPLHPFEEEYDFVN